MSTAASAMTNVAIFLAKGSSACPLEVRSSLVGFSDVN
jgi:hypothetical protein